ncbi:MAG: beta-lactamase family protein [Candidatus Eremiobacteraeota bacterium]|nr:beta-lactamase family protein [Candidatus Eremiobacteraeota bacterium]
MFAAIALSAALQNAVQANETPAAEIGVVRSGKLIVNDAYGMAKPEQHVRATPQTQFEIGSVTKQFTAAAILQLKENGKLNLSDPLGKYVPEYAQGKNITLEQLLWQVSGVPNYTEVNHFLHIAGTTPGGVDPAVALIAKKPLDFKPGTRFEYSNTNYILLGAVVARVSHMPWETYIRENIFDPAGMTQSAFIQDEPHLANAATGYTRGKNGKVQVAPVLHGPWAGAAGAIVSTVSDMAKWDSAFFGGRIISAQDVALATTAHRLPSGKSTGYGFGWFVEKKAGQPEIAHSGGTFGFASENQYFPSLHEFVIVLTNIAALDAGFIADQTFDAINPRIAALENAPAKGENPAITALARRWIERMQTGDIDKSQLSPAFARHLTPQLVGGMKQELAPLGAPTSLIYRGKSKAKGSMAYQYSVGFKGARLDFTIAVDGDGKISALGIDSE